MAQIDNCWVPVVAAWFDLHVAPSISGVVILTVSGVYQSQKMESVVSFLTHHFGGDFDHGRIMRPIYLVHLVGLKPASALLLLRFGPLTLCTLPSCFLPFHPRPPKTKTKKSTHQRRKGNWQFPAPTDRLGSARCHRLPKAQKEVQHLSGRAVARRRVGTCTEGVKHMGSSLFGSWHPFVVWFFRKEHRRKKTIFVFFFGGGVT